MQYGRYRLIYENYRSQIEFGYYRQGDTLPTIEQLCTVFSAAPQTVRSALLQLQEEDFIRLSPGRKTAVVYGAPWEECRRRRQDYYLARQDAMRDLTPVLLTLLIPLLSEGCRRLQPQALRRIRRAAAEPEEENFYLAFISGLEMILTLKNRLALDLYYELVSFYRFPHFLYQHIPSQPLSRRFGALSAQAVEACAQCDRAALFDVFMDVQRLFRDILQAYVRRAEGERPPQAQVPFRWKVYRERPQQCYSIAARLIEGVYISGAYAPGAFLPSYSALSKSLPVSLSTVRRAVDLLERLGVAAAVRGVGTQVRAPGEALPAPPERLVSMFQQALQLIRLSLEPTLARFFPALAGQRASACLEALRACQMHGAGFRPLYHCLCHLLAGETGRPAGEIWDKLYEVLLLGLPLLEAPAVLEPLAGRLCARTGGLIRGLEAGDAALFHDSLEGLLRLGQAAAEAAAKPQIDRK